jgi:hypothetical protein
MNKKLATTLYLKTFKLDMSLPAHVVVSAS